MTVRVMLGLDCDRPRSAFRAAGGYQGELDRVQSYLGGLVDHWADAAIGWTMFLCGQFVESLAESLAKSEVQARLGLKHPECEVACHSYEHLPIAPVPGRDELVAVSAPSLADDLNRNEGLLRWLLDDPNARFGFRAPYGADVTDIAPEVLSVVSATRLYSSTWLRTHADGVCPSLTMHRQPFKYKTEDLWEIPSHGWHDTVFAGMSPTSQGPSGISAHRYYGGLVSDACKLSRTAGDRFIYLGLVLHPIAMARYDPSGSLLDAIYEGAGADCSFVSYLEAATELGRRSSNVGDR